MEDTNFSFSVVVAWFVVMNGVVVVVVMGCDCGCGG